MEGRVLFGWAGAVLSAFVLAACQQQSGSAGLRTYPDAVVSINQVDPAYRSYFTSQHGANYTLSDQRKAFLAATRTARTPVPRYAPRPVASSSRRKATTRGKASSRRVARRGRAHSSTRISSRRTAARRSSARRHTSRKPQRRRKRS